MKRGFSLVEVIVVILIVAVIAVGIAYCAAPFTGNRQFFDTTYKFDRAVIRLPDGRIVEDEIVSWKDYDDSDQIQVTLANGDVYLVHSSAIALINEGN